MTSKEQLIERERQWALPVAIATLVGVAMVIISTIIGADVSGDGAAELLVSADENSSALWISSILQGIGWALLAAPLLYLFRAAIGRSDRMRGQLVGVVIVAPLFLAAAGVLQGAVTEDAASTFVAGSPEASPDAAEFERECRNEREDVGAESFRDEYATEADGLQPFRECVADEVAQSAVDEASLRPLWVGVGFAGRLGLAAALLYTCLYAMRTGLLTRFWGSLGMALGAIAFLILPFTLVWFIYFGFLALGWVPGGRPPAWAAGAAIPWPAPGQEPPAPPEEAVSGTARELPAAGEQGTAPDPTRQGGERRKRKRRRD